MIKRYSEHKLSVWVTMFVVVLTGCYLLIGASTWATKENGYGILPTFAITEYDANNKHTFVSLIFFVVGTLGEGIILAYFLDSIREIKKEFSMLAELQLFTAVWLIITDLVLFLVI